MIKLAFIVTARLKFIENQLLTILSQQQTLPLPQIEELSPSIPISFKPEMILDELTYTQQKLLLHISNHQKALNIL